MVERTKARVCVRWLAGVASSYPAGGMDICVYVSYSKDKKAKSQDSQDKEVRTKYKDRTKKITVGARFSVPVHTGPGAHPASYTMGTGSLSWGVKRPWCGANHSPPCSAEVKERVEIYLYSPSGPS